MGAFHPVPFSRVMDFVRDFVGGSCEGGNALSRFVGAAEKAGAQRDMWQREFLNQEGPSAFSDAHLRGQVPLPSMDANNFLFPQDPRTAQFPQTHQPDHFKEFDDIWDALPQEQYDGHIHLTDPNPAVSETFRDFLHATMHGEPMPAFELHPKDVAFAPVQRQQIRDRTAGLARHFCFDEQSTRMMEERLGTLFHSFGLDQRDAVRALQEGLQLHGQWAEDFQHFRAPEMHAHRDFREYENVWNRQVLPPPEVREWVNDYEQNWSNYRAPDLTEEENSRFGQAYKEAQEETAEDWVNEFVQEEMDERAEEERWFSQFLEPDGDEWAQEFTRSGGQRAAPQQAPPPSQLDDLTEKISQIPNPKLQQSEFMKFIRKVNSGEVQLQGLETRDNT